MSDDKQSMAGFVLKNPLRQAIGNNSDANLCLTFAFFERNKKKKRKKKSPDRRNLLTDRCYNGRSERLTGEGCGAACRGLQSHKKKMAPAEIRKSRNYAEFSAHGGENVPDRSNILSPFQEVQG